MNAVAAALRGWLAAHQRYAVLALTTAVLGLAVADRAALAVAAPQLADDLGLDAAALGWLLSAFAWSYVAAHLPAGWLIDRFGARRVVAVGLVGGALASLASAAAGVLAAAGWAAAGFALLLAMRVAVGAAQAPIGPAAGLSIAAWFPTAERGRAGALYGSSTYFTLAVASPLLGALAAGVGWAGMFAALALVAAALALLWRREYALPRRHRRVTPAELDAIAAGGALVELGERAVSPLPAAPPASTWADVRALASHRMTRGLFFAQYCINAITWFFVSWFPAFLVKGRGFGIAEAGAAAALPALAGFAGGVASGWFTDRLLRRSGSLTRARKTPLYVGIGVSLCAFVAAVFVESGWAVVLLLSLALAGKGFATLGWTLVADIAPTRIVGLVGAMFNAIGNLSGVVTPVAIGYLVAATGRFDAALWLMAAHCALALATYRWAVPKIERLAA